MKDNTLTILFKVFYFIQFVLFWSWLIFKMPRLPSWYKPMFLKSSTLPSSFCQFWYSSTIAKIHVKIYFFYPWSFILKKINSGLLNDGWIIFWYSIHFLTKSMKSSNKTERDGKRLTKVTNIFFPNRSQWETGVLVLP